MSKRDEDWFIRRASHRSVPLARGQRWACAASRQYSRPLATVQSDEKAAEQIVHVRGDQHAVESDISNGGDCGQFSGDLHRRTLIEYLMMISIYHGDA